MLLSLLIGQIHSRNYFGIFSFQGKKNVRTKSHAQDEPDARTRHHAREAKIVARPFWPPIKTNGGEDRRPTIVRNQ